MTQVQESEWPGWPRVLRLPRALEVWLYPDVVEIREGGNPIVSLSSAEFQALSRWVRREALDG